MRLRMEIGMSPCIIWPKYVRQHFLPAVNNFLLDLSLLAGAQDMLSSFRFVSFHLASSSLSVSLSLSHTITSRADGARSISRHFSVNAIKTAKAYRRCRDNLDAEHIVRRHGFPLFPAITEYMHLSGQKRKLLPHTAPARRKRERWWDKYNEENSHFLKVN